MYHIVFSWGWIRWFAHIGMFKALEEKWYTVSSVSWTSAGSIIWAFVAAKFSANQIEEIFSKKNIFQFFSPALSTFGPMDLSRIKTLIDQNIAYKNIESLPLPLTICATDIWLGEAMYFESGPISTLVTASSWVPWVFQPVKYKWLSLVDGGLIDNFPMPSWDKKIIGCDINPISKIAPADWKWILEKSLRIMTNYQTKSKAKKCEIFLQPPELTKIMQSPFYDIKKIIDIGYRHWKKVLEQKEIIDILENKK